MNDVGILDRFMRSSVDRAVAMQPRRTKKIADEYLYAAPAARPGIEAIRSAARRLVDAGLSSPGLGGVAVRRSERTVTRVAPGTDLGAVDARHLETVGVESDDPLVSAASAVGAAVLAHPVSLLALAVSKNLDAIDSRSLEALGALAGGVAVAERPTSEGVWVVPGVGVIAIAVDLMTAVTRLEAAERLAAITLAIRER
jgi:hypothetical protein